MGLFVLDQLRFPTLFILLETPQYHVGGGCSVEGGMFCCTLLYGLHHAEGKRCGMMEATSQDVSQNLKSWAHRSLQRAYRYLVSTV